MATLVLNEDQQMLREAATRFMADKAPVSQLRKLRDEESADGFDRATWGEMAEMGFAGALIAEEYGGSAFGHVAMGQIMEAGGRTLAASPLFASGVLGASAVSLAGSDAQKAEWLPKIASGELLAALAVDETARHLPERVETTAVREGDGWVLTGRKANVADGHVADLLIVSARTDAGVAMFAVEPGAKGLDIERTIMVDSRNAAIVRLESTPAAALGDVTGGEAALAKTLDIGRAHLAAELLGLSQEAFARTVTYLNERKQFGVLIGSFQSLQHRSAHLFAEIELLKSAVIAALSALDEGSADAPKLVCMAKAKAAGVGDLATNEGVQMHGGMGMTDQFDIGLFMKRARPAAQMFGDERYQAARFATLSGY